MKLKILLKFLAAAVCITVGLVFLNRDSALEKQIYKISTTKLKNDPALDSAVNRKLYAFRRAVIKARVMELEKKRHPAWQKNIAPLLCGTGLFLAQLGWSALRT